MNLADFLKSMSTDLPGLYLLGSLNRHITIHSQQCRAINLIHALIHGGGGLDDKSVAVVGAGFAGLTAAAYALEKSTARVSLFDTAPRPLWLQDHCANRWIHPGIYDWPLPGSLEPRTALPILNWRADAARNVAKHVRAEWERLAARHGRLTCCFETKVDSINKTSTSLLVELANGDRKSFDLVVLAVGFGMEEGGPGRISYWSDIDGIDDAIPKGSSVLVSGFGDGGLADVLRLCLPEYRQDNLIELVRHVPQEICKQLVEWEDRFRLDAAALDRHYRDLRVDGIIDKLSNSKPSVRLTLAGREYLYGQRSAILNRFLVSQLHQALNESAFTVAEGPVDEQSLTILRDGRRCVTVGGKEQTFDRVVFRLGPAPVFSRIKPMDNWKVGQERRQHWLQMPQSLDQTRFPLWDPRNSAAREAEPQREFLAYESSLRPWCLVVRPPKTTIDWGIRAGEALKRLHKEGAYDINPRPLVLDSLLAIENEEALKDAVRALCAADIVIADITGYNESVLFLLGIRAAVRRGVTITCTQEPVSPEFWSKVPFNLKELKLISLNHVELGLKDLVDVLHAGLAQSGRGSADYLDLPVYDYVRRASLADADASRVLLLRAFKADQDDRNLLIDSGVGSALRSRLTLATPIQVKTVIDQASPRLAGQRLYEAIRHWRTCVVDLTWWRANVMFELGVRLAVTEHPTYCLEDVSVGVGGTSSDTQAALRRLLHPFHYNLKTENFNNAFAKQISPAVYQTTARHFRISQDLPDLQVDEFLEAAAPIKPSLQEVDLRQLYAASNADYAAQLRHRGVEMRCAAWYYLVDREQPHRMRPIDLLDPHCAEIFDRYRKLGSQLKTDLAQRTEPRDRRLLEDVDAKMNVSAKLSTPKMAELLAEWQALRSELEAGFHVPLGDARETQAVLEDYEVGRRHLAELRDWLKDLGNPVCELPLQAVQLDLQRFDAELNRKKIPGGSS